MFFSLYTALEYGKILDLNLEENGKFAYVCLGLSLGSSSVFPGESWLEIKYKK